jgi:hypothetical protein
MPILVANVVNGPNSAVVSDWEDVITQQLRMPNMLKDKESQRQMVKQPAHLKSCVVRRN